MEAILAATSRASECVKQDSITGTLTEGKAEDLLLLDANPLDNLGILQDCQHI